MTALTPVILLRFTKEGFNECLRLCPAAAAEFRLRLVRPLQCYHGLEEVGHLICMPMPLHYCTV